jgi:hypothetical protein
MRRSRDEGEAFWAPEDAEKGEPPMRRCDKYDSTIAWFTAVEKEAEGINRVDQ